jgi:hypothetical protein
MYERDWKTVAMIMFLVVGILVIFATGACEYAQELRTW